MFKLTHPLPEKVLVAVSGGLDSMVATHWLRMSKKVVGIIHVHHNSGDFSDEAFEFVKDKFSDVNGLSLHLHWNDTYVTTEEGWRDLRYSAFHSYGDIPVVTAHHANDCLEEYISCTMKRGYMGTIPYRNGNVIRPFRNWTKASMVDYAKKNQIKYLDDPSNEDTKYLRNRIRHELVPKVLEINPGIWSLVEKAITMQDDFDSRSIPEVNRFTKL